MRPELWYLVLGALLVAVALIASIVKHLPFTTTMLYLAVGAGLGPLGLGVLKLDPLAHARLLERIVELALIVSLFTAGLKFRVELRDPIWRLPLRLASLTMLVTVGLTAAAGVRLLGLPLGAAVLLGALLAPTDPVLASDVQLAHPGDRNRLRFALTGEASLNDGSSYAFALLGLGLLGLHDLGRHGLRWLLVDLAWAVPGGLAIGFALGTLVGRYVLHLRREHKEGFGLDDFLALGLIGLSYGAALLAKGNGFLAVFAAGLALRQVERRQTGEESPDLKAVAKAASSEEIATDPESAPAYMAEAVLGFNEQIERILEFGVVLLVGAMLSPRTVRLADLGFVALVFLLVRPAAVYLGLAGSAATRLDRAMAAWFGVRGVASLFYLAFAVRHGLAPGLAARLASLALLAVAASVLAHGISVTPLTKLYERREEGREERQEGSEEDRQRAGAG
jgi:sodium/hydrogen antiporter